MEILEELWWEIMLRIQPLVMFIAKLPFMKEHYQEKAIAEWRSHRRPICSMLQSMKWTWQHVQKDALVR